MENYWINKNKILEKLKDKKLLFWGSGEWVEKTIKVLNIKPEYILDNSPNIQGDIQRGVEVVSYEKVKDNIEEYYIVITTGSYPGLIRDLISKGLTPEKDFCCSPSMVNLSIRDRILSVDRDILFSVTASSKTDNGGLYIYNTKTRAYKKLYEGKSRAIAKSENYIVMTDEEKGLVIFDIELNLKKEIKLLLNAVPHGVALSEKMNKVFVGNAGRDSVSVYDLTTYEHLEEIKLSKKYDKLKEEQHHINDLYVDEPNDTLFISMFSFTGNWRSNVYDGGILEYDLEEGKFNGPLVQDMWMPHSVQIVENKLMFVDSMRGDLYETSNKVIGNFNGFIRGLTYDNDYLYIGQSSHRYFDRLKNISLNIPLDCGIYIFDKENKASTFHSLHMFENIHSIVAV